MFVHVGGFSLESLCSYYNPQNPPLMNVVDVFMRSQMTPESLRSKIKLKQNGKLRLDTDAADYIFFWQTTGMLTGLMLRS